jgi:serine protease AprX
MPSSGSHSASRKAVGSKVRSSTKKSGAAKRPAASKKASGKRPLVGSSAAAKKAAEVKDIAPAKKAAPAKKVSASKMALGKKALSKMKAPAKKAAAKAPAKKAALMPGHSGVVGKWPPKPMTKTQARQIVGGSIAGGRSGASLGRGSEASEIGRTLEALTKLMVGLTSQAQLLSLARSAAHGDLTFGTADLLGQAAQRAASLASELVGLGRRLVAPAAAKREAASKLSLVRSTEKGLRQAILSDPACVEVARELEAETVFTIYPRTRSGRPLRSFVDHKGPLPLHELEIDEQSRDNCVKALKKAGCEVLRKGKYSITASAPAAVLNTLLGTTLRLARSQFKPSEDYGDLQPSELYVSTGGMSNISGWPVHKEIDDFVFGAAPISLLPVPDTEPPKADFVHLTSDLVRQYLSLPSTGPDALLRGRGIDLALIDTGFHHVHPFFVSNNFQLEPRITGRVPFPEDDPKGHGTMMAWNIFAVAPECRVLGFVHLRAAPQDSIAEARAAGAAVINCSWGLPPNAGAELAVIRLEIEDAIKQGAIVLAAGGNGTFAWPAVLPEVIAVGGVFADPKTGDLSLSDFTVRGDCAGRVMPDICGLCGNGPSGVYLPLPCKPGSEKDVTFGAVKHPNGDGLGTKDGWVYASGSSSATAQVAAVVVLMVQKAKGLGFQLDQEKVRKILSKATVAVNVGSENAPFVQKMPQNGAIGGGLIDAAKALSLTKP